MPQRPKPNQPTPKSEQARLLWGSKRVRMQPALTDWDPKQVELVQAIFNVLESGSTVVFRPGSGNRSIGVAIWEGDHRWPPTWCYDQDELDEWAAGVNEEADGLSSDAAD